MAKDMIGKVRSKARLSLDNSEFTNREKRGRRGLEVWLRMRVPSFGGVVTTSTGVSETKT